MVRKAGDARRAPLERTMRPGLGDRLMRGGIFSTGRDQTDTLQVGGRHSGFDVVHRLDPQQASASRNCQY